MKKMLSWKRPSKLCFREGNPKTDKNKKIKGLENYRILRLNLAPADLSGYNVCPMASIGCKSACLHTAGNPVYQKQKDIGRINRNRFYIQARVEFLKQLIREIKNHELYCNKNKLIPVVRLNTTSDISWEIHNIFELFPNVQFYDYTKISKRLGKTPSNYKLMFSYSGADKYQKHVKEALKTNVPISVVFKGTLPETYSGRRVIDGDKSDLDNLFAGNVVVGLRAKGKAKTDTSKFIVVANT